MVPEHYRSKRGVHLPGYENTVFDKDGVTDWCRRNGFTKHFDCKRALMGLDGVNIESFPPGFFDASNTALRVGAFVYTIISFLCVLMTIFFMVILILGWRTHFQFPIYRIIFQLSISYLILSISQFFTNIPMYLFNFNNGQDVSIIPFFIEQSLNYAAILFYTLLTVNRLVIFTLKPLKEMFTGINLYISIVVCWLVAFSASAFMVFYGCTRIYGGCLVNLPTQFLRDSTFRIAAITSPRMLFIYKDISGLSDGDLWLYRDVCAPQSDIVIVCYGFVFYTFYIIPFINLLMYIAMGVSMFLSRTGTMVQISKTEISLMKQSAVVFGVYMIAISLSIAQAFMRFRYQTQVYITTMVIGVMDPLLGVIFVGTFVGSNQTVQKAIVERIPKQFSKVFGKREEEPIPEQVFARRGTHTQ